MRELRAGICSPHKAGIIEALFALIAHYAFLAALSAHPKAELEIAFNMRCPYTTVPLARFECF